MSAQIILGAKRLERLYQQVSHRGCFDVDSLQEMADLADEVALVALPNEKLVAQSLSDFFRDVIGEWEKIPQRTTTWPRVDNALLRATVFVAKGGSADDAVNITLSIRAQQQAWLA